MNKKYIICLIAIIVICVVILVVGMNMADSNRKVDNNTTNITITNNTTNVTPVENNTVKKQSNNRYEEIRDEEYLGDEVVYKDTYTGKYYYQGQEMNYEKLADDYNREHKVGPYADEG